MTSIPQLRKDINDLQEKLRIANERIAELEAMPPVVREIKVVQDPVVIRETVHIQGSDNTVYVDNPAHIEMIRRLQAELRGR